MKQDKILLAHGSGGNLSRQLVEELFLPPFNNPILSRLEDAAVINWDERLALLAFTTDSYTVKPLFFPGGDIGRLAVAGTVNDLAMMGARPLYLSSAFVIEEGFPLSVLRRVVESMRRATEEARVTIVAGDTKVVERGFADKIFVNTAGIGLVPEGRRISGSGAEVGDVVIISGPIGDHGIAVLSKREGIAFGTSIESDVAPLNHLVEAMLEASRGIHVLRDPTRGGLASTLNEIAQQSKVAIHLDEGAIPVREGVLAACEMLGYDPLYVANEGKLVAIVAPEDGERVLEAMHRTRYGEEACIIGEVVAKPAGRVVMRTGIGGTRIVDMLTGEMLPRIC